MSSESAHHSTALHTLEEAIDERVGISDFRYPVPEHANSIKYMLGGITLFCFITAMLSGMYIAQFYNPHPLYAHDSVAYIISQVFLGDFMRSVHYWSAYCALFFMGLHALRVFLYGSYKKPREVTWLSGVVLLLIALALIFSGTVLKWDQEAVEALAHNEAIASFLGSLGVLFSSSFTVSLPFLTRIYLAHVSMLGFLFFTVLLAHLYLIKKHGISPKAVYGAVTHSTHGKGTSNFLEHVKVLNGYGLMAVSVIATLALVYPAPIGHQGVPGVELTKPPLVFLPLYTLENMFGINALLWGPIVILIPLFLLPFVDRSKWISPHQRKAVISLGIAYVLILVLLGLYAWIAPVKPHMKAESRIPKLPNIVEIIIPKAEAHGSESVKSNPMNIMIGKPVRIVGDGLKPDRYTLSVKGLHKTLDLGTIVVENGQEGFSQEFLLPVEKPDVFQIILTKSNGQKIYSNDPLTVETTLYSNSAIKASGKELDIHPQKSPEEIVLIFCLILTTSFLGAILVV